MKVILASTLLLLSLMLNVVNAKDALIEEPELQSTRQPVQSDAHFAWHDFRVRLGRYPRVTASMTDGGVITLQGFVGPFEGDKLEELASQVKGATKVINNTGTK